MDFSAGHQTSPSFAAAWSFDVFKPQLPRHCQPSNDFLYHTSAVTHTCIPTPLAFMSTFVGTCSIIAWLFAQVPQIIKNFQLSSASGLSAFFLVEWLAGDLSNFLGALLTGQATWQVVIGFYYCTADLIMVVQYFWYEHLRHGSPLRVVWVKRYPDGHIEPDNQHSIAALDFAHGGPTPGRPPHRRSKSSSIAAPQQRRGSRRVVQRGYSSPFGPATPPGKLVMTLTLLLAILVRASPVPDASIDGLSTQSEHKKLEAAFVGTILSWCSTALYLFSRIPQLVKNQRRKSTAGLSISLFVAAFLGNLFYSASLLLNPNAWSSYGPYGGGGWAGSGGSDQEEWILAATPFFIGAAGVLIMDGCVYLQFLRFGDGIEVVQQQQQQQQSRRQSQSQSQSRTPEASGLLDDGGSSDNAAVAVPEIRQRVLVVESQDTYGRRKWDQVRGWMRGWKPSYSVDNSVAGTERDRSTSPSRPRSIRTRSESGSRTPSRYGGSPFSYSSYGVGNRGGHGHSHGHGQSWDARDPRDRRDGFRGAGPLSSRDRESPGGHEGGVGAGENEESALLSSSWSVPRRPRIESTTLDRFADRLSRERVSRERVGRVDRPGLGEVSDAEAGAEEEDEDETGEQTGHDPLGPAAAMVSPAPHRSYGATDAPS